MLKLRVITPLCVLFVLQVFSDEASQPKFSCASLCEQVDFGYAGICCGKIKNIKVKKKLFFLWQVMSIVTAAVALTSLWCARLMNCFATPLVKEEFKRLNILIYIFSKLFFRWLRPYIWTTMQWNRVLLCCREADYHNDNYYNNYYLNFNYNNQAWDIL